MNLKEQNLELRKKQWLKFYDPNSDLKRLLVIFCNEGMPEQPPAWAEKKEERIEYIWHKYNVLMENMDTIKDSIVPHLNMLTGTEIFAEAFGCKVHKPASLPTCALPLITSSHEAAKITKPSVLNSSLAYLFEMADELQAKAGKDALFSLPDVQSPMGIVNLIWERESLYIAMIEEPEAVKELAEMVKELIIEFFDLWFARYGKDFVAHWPFYYMPNGLTFSEDDIGVVSNDMYKEFFEKNAHDLAKHYGNIGIHCCADSKHQWDNFKCIPNLSLLNLHRPEEILKEAYEYFKDKCAMWPQTEYPFNIFSNNVPRDARIILHFYSASKEKAIEIVKRFDEELEVFNNQTKV